MKTLTRLTLISLVFSSVLVFCVRLFGSTTNEKVQIYGSNNYGSAFMPCTKLENLKIYVPDEIMKKTLETCFGNIETVDKNICETKKTDIREGAIDDMYKTELAMLSEETLGYAISLCFQTYFQSPKDETLKTGFWFAIEGANSGYDYISKIQKCLLNNEEGRILQRRDKEGNR